VQTALREHQEDAEARPDVFVRITRAQGIDKSRRAVANLLNVPVNECVFVKNATTGVNTVLRNLDFKPEDAIIYFDTVYGAVEYGIISLMESTPVQACKVPYQFPISHEELVARFRQVVSSAKGEGLNVRVAVFDTIVSVPGVRFPFERLIEVCREEGVLSLVDGAHGIGHIPLDLGKLQPDFFTSNCHKYVCPFLTSFFAISLWHVLIHEGRWLYVPRGCAVLYVPLRNQHLIRTTLPTSWGFIPRPSSSAPMASATQSKDTKSAFEYLFEYVPTTDDTPYLCVPAAMKFRAEVCGGEEKIYTYLEELANEASDLIAKALGTEVMQEPGLKEGEVSQIRRCGMATVRLPIAISTPDDSVSSEDAITTVHNGNGSSHLQIQPSMVPIITKWFRDTLINHYGTFVVVFQYGDWLWIRLSAQIYLEKSDFEWLSGVLKECCVRIETEADRPAKL
jgi:PERQ amino acid-rich with GYF domain-containing protein